MNESRAQVFVLAGARLADTTGNGFLIVLLPAYLSSSLFSPSLSAGPIFLASGTMIGIAVSAYSYVSAGLQPYTGRLSDWVGVRRPFVLLGLGIVGVGNLLYPLAETYGYVVAVHAIQGLGAALALPASMAIINDITRRSNRGGNMGIFNSIRLLGYVIGPVLAGFLITNGPYTLSFGGFSSQISGFQIAFWGAGCFAFIGMALVVAFVTEPAVQPTTEENKTSLTILGHNQLFHPVFALAIATFLMSVTVDLIVALQSDINSHLGQTASEFGLQYSALIMAVVLLIIPFGIASDRFGRRPFLLGGVVLLIPVIAVQGFIQSELLMVAARFTQGIAMAMAFAPSLAFAGDFASSGQSGQWMAVITSAYGFGRASGPAIGGFLGSFGYVIPFLAGGLISVIAMLLIVTQVGYSDRFQPVPGGVTSDS
ncbi:MFS transporter [Halomicrobium sp. HM KBTZ05]|uniref:MFS transporter n=1 Tax=Halomicrobium sp. HM KBTZ05 TaxID=3242663 RepID=UPI003558A534